MAHFKRGYAKTKTRGRKRRRDERRVLRGYTKERSAWLCHYHTWMQTYPKYWDVEFHTRPKRRKTRRCEIAVLKGADPDNLAWPLGNHKPHNYYW